MTNAEKVKQIKAWLHDLTLEEVREVNRTAFELAKVKAAAKSASVKSALRHGMAVTVKGFKRTITGTVMDIKLKKASVKEDGTGIIYNAPMNIIVPR